MANLYAKTAVHIAAEKDFPHIIAYLYELGADLNAETLEKNTPLHLAIDMNSFRAIGLLLTLNIRKNAKNSQSKTALHIASKSNSGKVIRLLLLKGFDKNIRDIDGKLPEELCTDPNVRRLFKSSGILEVLGCRQLLADGEKKNYWPPLLLSLVMIVFFIINSVFLENCEAYLDSNVLTYLFAGLIFSSVGVMLVLIFIDPGYLSFGERRMVTVLKI